MRGQIRWSYTSVHPESKQECATLQSKNWLIQNEKWGKAEFFLLLETSTLFILGDPLEVLRGDPTDCGRPEAASRGQHSSRCRIKSGSLGSASNHPLDTGALGSKTLKRKGSSVVFWVDHRAYMLPRLNRTVLCKLGRSSICDERDQASGHSTCPLRHLWMLPFGKDHCIPSTAREKACFLATDSGIPSLFL